MTEDVQVEVLRRTQDSLGKFIKKPVLTEKLLKKPPFRFLHDICTAAMKETGFFEGVLSSADIKIENIKDKEGKILFLQKVITAVEAANNTKLSVRPNKIVAGHEPTNTNQFLQALAAALEHQVKKKKNIEKPVKQPQELKDSSDVKKRSEDSRSKLKKKTEKVTEEKVKVKKPKKKAIIDEQKEKPNDEKLVNGYIKSEQKTVEKDTVVEIENTRRPQSAKPNHRKASSRRKAEDLHEENKDHLWGNKVDNDTVPYKDEKIDSLKKENGSKEPLFPSVESQPTRKPLENEPDSLQAVPAKNEEKTDIKPEINSKASDNVAKLEAPPKVKESEEVEKRPQTALPRPPSARPAAPRVRERGVVSLPQQEVLRFGTNSGKLEIKRNKKNRSAATSRVNLITDSNEQDEDNEELVSVVQQQELLEELPAKENFESKTAAVADSDHGHLVAQILQKQRELEDAKSSHTEIEWGDNRSREITQREIDRVRAAVQEVTRTVYPLGKLLEFLPEDLDAMQQELTMWQGKYVQLMEQLEKERSLTEASIEPLKIHLTELKAQLKEHKERLAVTKANVLRNEEKTQQVLSGW